MGRYKIKILPTAQEDMTYIVDYLNTLSLEAALRYYDLLIGKIMSLSDMPERCAPARDTQLRLRGYRALIVEKYLVFYVTLSDTVQIRRIIYSKRQYETLI
jgi:plasmid stabilization system protein ParE